jgi:hypothetical protein
MNTDRSPSPSALSRVAVTLSDFFWPYATDPAWEHATPPPPILRLGDEVVGGRVQLGPPVAALHRFGVAASVVVFSWGALLPFLLKVGDHWLFVPSQQTELLRVTLRQRIVRERLLPALLTWCVLLTVGFAVAAMLLASARFADRDNARFVVLAAMLMVCVSWIGANWALLRRLRALGEAMFRTAVAVDYGYPGRTQLFEVLSDGTLDEQFARVNDLFARFRTSDFAPWTQATVDGGRGGGVVFGAVGGSDTVKKVFGAGVVLAMVVAVFRFLVVPIAEMTVQPLMQGTMTPIVERVAAALRRPERVRTPEIAISNSDELRAVAERAEEDTRQRIAEADANRQRQAAAALLASQNAAALAAATAVAAPTAPSDVEPVTTKPERHSPSGGSHHRSRRGGGGGGSSEPDLGDLGL